MNGLKALFSTLVLLSTVFLTSQSFAKNTNISASNVGHKNSTLNKETIKSNETELFKVKRSYSQFGCVGCHHN